MADIRVVNEIVIVNDTATGEPLINTVMVDKRVETEQTLFHGDIIDIPSTALFSLPLEGAKVEVGKSYNYNGETITCIQSHLRTIYTPEETPALFKMGSIFSCADWVQPLEAQTAYNKGQCAKFNDVEYVSNIDSNVWSLATTPEYWDEKNPVFGPTCEDWVQPTGAQDAYNIGDCAKFDGVSYISNIDGNVWDLATTPQYWDLKV